MKRRIRSVLALASALALFAAGAASADTQLFASKEEARAAFDGFMKTIVADQPEAAFAALEPYFPLEAAEIAGVKLQAVQQRNLMKPRFGRSLEWTFVREEALGDFLVRYTYVEKFERHAVRWMLTIYRPGGAGWLVNSVFFDDDIQAALRP
jgi:hypothetical protein